MKVSPYENMIENKKEPLSINNGSNPKGRKGSVRKKRPEHRKRKLKFEKFFRIKKYFGNEKK